MRRTLVIALVALLVLPGPGLATAPDGGSAAPTAAATVPDDRPRTDAPGTAPGAAASAGVATNHTVTTLDLVGPTTAGYGVPHLDFGATVATVDTDLAARYRVERAEVRVAGGAPATVRAAVLRAEVDAIEGRLERLRARERAAVRAHHDGNTTERQLLQELARIDAEAETLQRSLRALDTVDDDVEGVDISTRAGSLRAQLELLEGPVRERVDGALEGENPPPLVRVRTAESGVVLGTVAGDRYYREAVRFDKVNRSAPDTLEGFGDLDQRAADRYGQPPVSLSRPSEGLYIVEVDHPRGTITAHFDGGTGDLFREVQSLRTAALPRTGVANRTGDGLRVAIERTARGGPLLVTVTDASTGDPVDATVSVQGTTLGRTGDDGALWTVEPEGVYRLQVVSGTRANNVTVSS